jgi:hypothetical protein
MGQLGDDGGRVSSRPLSVCRRIVALASFLALTASLALGATSAWANGGPIVANGAPVTAIVSTPDTPETFTFTGTAGEIVTLTSSDSTFAGGCDVSMSIIDPYGNNLGSSCAGGNDFVGETELESAGTYTVDITPNNADTGQTTLSLSANAADSTITANGPAVTFVATHTGQGRDYEFTGTAGEVVTLTASAGTYAGGCDVAVTILTPNGANIGTGCAGGSGFVGETTLPAAGTYTVAVTPNNGDTGQTTLSLSAIAAPSTITGNGAAVTFTATHSGQGREYSFTISAPLVVTLTAADGTYAGGCDVSMAIIDPTGHSLGSSCAGGSGYIGETTLTSAGTYTVDVTPNNGDTGQVTLSLSADAPNSTITANGAAVTFVATHTGQGRNYTFTGTAGEVVTLAASAGTYPGGCDVAMTILTPNGAGIGSSCAGGSGFVGETTLPAAGTYTVAVTPNDGNTGQTTLSLSQSAAPSTITGNGAAVTFTATHSGQGREYTFTVSAPLVVTLSASDGTYPGGCDVSMAIIDPTGHSLGSSCAGASGFIGETTLPTAGTYTVDVTPNNGDTGQTTLSLSADAPDSTITANGAAVTFVATHTGQGRNYTFAGTAGEVVTLAASAGTYPGGCDVAMTILTPNGASIGSSCAGGSGFVGETTLPAAGTYTVAVTPNNGNTGQTTLSLSANAANSTITGNGAAVTFTATHSGQGREYTFTIGAPLVVTLTASDGTYPGGCDVSMSIIDPYGHNLGSSCAGDAGFVGETQLEAAGTYTVDVTPGNGDTGQTTVSLSADAAPSTITANGPAVTFVATHSGQGREYTFSGTAGEVVTLTASGGTYAGSCDISMAILDPNGHSRGNSCAGQSGTVSDVTLPAAGTFVVDVTPSDGDTGETTLTLTS